MIQEVEGPSLYKIWKYYNNLKSIVIATVYRLDIELLINLKILHRNELIHVDIKEGNFVSLFKPKLINKEIINFCLIDLGWAIKYTDENVKHLEKSKFMCMWKPSISFN